MSHPPATIWGVEDVSDRTARELKAYLAGLDPARLTIAQAARLLRNFAEIQRLAAGAMLLLGPRAVEGELWLRAGHSSQASWLAEVQQVPLGEAVATLETAERLTDLEATKGALRRGKLSAAQAREIAGAASRNPGAERELLQSAQTDSFRELKDKARAAKAAARTEEQRAEIEERIRKTRFLRTWTDDEGAFRLEAKATQDVGALILSELTRRANKLFEKARKEDEWEPSPAYLLDALTDLCRSKSDSGPTNRPRADVTLFVSAEALMRGSLENDEICEIPGVGPVSLSLARNLIGDCFLKFVITKGKDIATVGHYGRTIPSHVTTALRARDRVCVVPGCGVSLGLEADHWQVPFHRGGISALENLALLCTHHHRLKTHRGWALAGGPGQWRFLKPAGEPDEPPPRLHAHRRRPRPSVGASRLFDSS
ncbi:MAG: HNH endonuclease signature motif containing protein [Acidimicrobiales bacterium]